MQVQTNSVTTFWFQMKNSNHETDLYNAAHILFKGKNE